LSGDVAHFWDNFCCRRVPHLNADKEKSKQSMDKLERLAKLESATIWFNHDFEQNKTVPHAPDWIDCSFMRALMGA
jgi:N-acyl homoserine lactone hydrolase